MASTDFHVFDLQFNDDWTGQPGVWVWIHLNPNYLTSKAAIEVSTVLMMKVSRALLDANLNLFPYVGFREDKALPKPPLQPREDR